METEVNQYVDNIAREIYFHVVNVTSSRIVRSCSCFMNQPVAAILRRK